MKNFINRLSATILILFMVSDLLVGIRPVYAVIPTDVPLYSWKTPTTFAGGTLAYFDLPSFVSFDLTGNMFVADSNLNKVFKFDPSGILLTSWGGTGSGDGQFNTIWGMAIDSAGNVYLSDWTNNRVEKFDNNGNYLLKWGSSGSGDGQFNIPAGIEIDASGKIYVADMFNYRIQVFDSSGGFLSKYGTTGAGDGQFNRPIDIAFDSAGDIYICDYGNNRIQKFDSSWAFIRKWGGLGSGDGQFDHAEALAVDSSNNVYVSDRNNYRIQKFNSDGGFLLKWGSQGMANNQLDMPRGVTAYGSSIYVVDRENDRIVKFDTSGNFQYKWGSSSNADGEFDGIYGISVDTAGNMYVAEGNNYRIQKFDSAGNFITKWGSSGTGDGQFNMIFDIANDSANNIYVADLGNSNVQVFDSDGGFLSRWTGIFSAPSAIGVNAHDFVYVIDCANIVRKLDTSGNVLSSWGGTGSADGKLNFAPAISFDSADNVYILDQGNARIQKFDSDGNFLAKWGAAGSGDGQFLNPYGLEVGSAGYVYVADTDNDRILKFDTAGNYITKWGSTGVEDDEFVHPIRLTVGPNDSVYVADTSLNSVRVFEYDMAGPVISLNALSENPTNDATPLFLGIATDDSRTVDIVQFQIDSAVGSWSDCTADDGVFDEISEAFTCTVTTSLSSGLHTIYVRATDSSENTTSSLTTYEFTIDVDGPTGSISINGGEEFCNDPIVSLTPAATDTLSNVADMMISNDAGFSGSIWETYSTTKVWTLSSDDGEKTVYIKYRDETGNESEISTSTIILDTTLPTGAITINNGAAYTNVSNVTLTITGEDETTTISGMLISEDPNFTGAQWKPYSTTEEQILTDNDEVKTLYIKFIDDAGNQSSTYSDDIILDTSASLTLFSIAEQDYNEDTNTWQTEDQTPTITGNGEAGATITIAINGDNYSETYTLTIGVEGAWEWTPSTALIAGEDYTLTIIMTDLAGNQTEHGLTLGISDTRATELPETGTHLLFAYVLLGILIILRFQIGLLNQRSKR